QPLRSLALAHAAQRRQRLHLRLARNGLARFPVVDRLRADAGQLAVFRRRQAQLFAVRLQALGLETYARRIVIRSSRGLFRPGRTRSGLQLAGERRDLALERGDVATIAGIGLAQGIDLGL